MEEKRKAFRIKSSLFIQYSFFEEGNLPKWDISTVRDISETGVSLLTGKRFNPSDTIVLRIKIPSRPFDLTEVKGKVVASENTDSNNTFLTRIQFVETNKETQNILKEYINWVIKNYQDK
ncbi:MAG: PilZ domain-containing protein [Candidatus Omnitrophica bacterium]|nr:PilZ domain-containing protein [Candidatus Omnitrophota bacterium]